jgi:hypothetical protein
MNLLTLGLVCKEFVDLGNGTVEGDDIDTMVGSVEDQVLTHDSQANEAEISSGHIVSDLSSSDVGLRGGIAANIYACQAGAERR